MVKVGAFHRPLNRANVVVSSHAMDWKNKFYFGDNLNILRSHAADASVDLRFCVNSQ